MEEFIKSNTMFVAEIVEFAAVVVIGYASLKEFIHYFRDLLLAKIDRQPDINIRISLGKSLAFSLELLLAADILRTAISPTWDEIGQLAAIATIRTALNYFLERDLKNKKEQQNE
jgi:uncharacterized membrane protein